MSTPLPTNLIQDIQDAKRYREMRTAITGGNEGFADKMEECFEMCLREAGEPDDVDRNPTPEEFDRMVDYAIRSLPCSTSS